MVLCCNGCWSDRREDAVMLSTEIVELQIGLKNYDPQKDKRLSGSVKIGLMYALCVLFEDKEVGEDKEKTLEEYEKVVEEKRKAKGVEKVSLKNSEFPKVSGCKRIDVISQGADPVVASDGCGVIKESDANLKTELKSDVEEEWMKLCPVELVKVCENRPQGVVLVRFKDMKDAHKCIGLTNGRWQVHASIDDGTINHVTILDVVYDEARLGWRSGQVNWMMLCCNKFGAKRLENKAHIRLQ
ncbi:hypothetical protein C5167_032578 [Papaver somniferum]|uniref:Uncharacterized protein n=1 Tax=Papaver somniferum TaxID=3469 RepID=A0A4Y7K7Z9_PAPSO|nr:hypothetical protein C5167_032578 [Papaver somniferum]